MSQIGRAGRFFNIFKVAIEGLLPNQERLAYFAYLEICETLKGNVRRFFLHREFNHTYSNFGSFSIFDQCRATLDVFQKSGEIAIE